MEVSEIMQHMDSLIQGVVFFMEELKMGSQKINQ